MAQTIGKLPTRLYLPTLPRTDDADVRRWAVDLHDSLDARLFTLLSRLLLFVVSNKGSVSFGAADTSKAVSFDGREEDASYMLLPIPGWNTTVWVTAKTVTGATLNVGTAPGGGGGTVEWIAVR